ncbi:MAG: tRNA (N6-threonylcarbamoyladenosine(37)-N6)-methyltransferase TrmO [Halothiobacillus sp.]
MSPPQAGLARLELTPVATVQSPFKSRFGIPRQSGLVPEAPGVIVPITPWDRAEAWFGIEQYSHLWLIWHVHDRPHQPVSSVRPPRLGGNSKMGLFATRSPARPNPLGLSLVRLMRVENTAGRVRIHISGLDLLDGTPIFDIKPHIGFTDCPKGSDSGFAREEPFRLAVDWSEVSPEHITHLNEHQRRVIEQTLALDPRPAFHDDPMRHYGCPIFEFNVRFRVQGKTIFIINLSNMRSEPANG